MLDGSEFHSAGAALTFRNLTVADAKHPCQIFNKNRTFTFGEKSKGTQRTNQHG